MEDLKISLFKSALTYHINYWSLREAHADPLTLEHQLGAVDGLKAAIRMAGFWDEYHQWRTHTVNNMIKAHTIQLDVAGQILLS